MEYILDYEDEKNEQENINVIFFLFVLMSMSAVLAVGEISVINENPSILFVVLTRSSRLVMILKL